MEPLSKSNSQYIIFITLIIFLGCKPLDEVSINKPYQKIKISDTINITGYLFYDSKKGIANFLEVEKIDLNKLSKKEIHNYIKDSRNVVLLREGLKEFKNAEFLSLTLCNKNKKFIIKNKDLLYKRFSIIRLENFTFYKNNRVYDDGKRRLLFCIDNR